MTTPIERGAEAVRPLLDYSLFPEDAPDITRAVFESIDRQDLALPIFEELINHPGCEEDQLTLEIAGEIANAIITHLTGKEQL